ncbi:MAG: hypothetical protein QNJ44_21920 [Rhodobacter sp.]|nr:hypothetical protein [Rhodobacter sp.]
MTPGTSFLISLNAPLATPDIRIGQLDYRGPKDGLTETAEGAEISLSEAGGAFGKVVYRAADDTLVLSSDITGQLALRYVIDGTAVRVASHDIALAPYCAFDPDGDSLDHVRRIGWSVGNASLIQGIEVARGGETVEIANGAATVTPARFPTGPQPLETMLDYFGQRLPAGPVEVEISAGFDSRAALAATLACKPATDIRLFTEGPEDSLDVQLARKIAGTLGVPLDHRNGSHPTTEAFFQAWDAATLATNGHIEINILASADPSAPPRVCGDGGEIYRGYYDRYRPFQRVLGGKPAHGIDRKLGDSARVRAAISRLAADGPDSAVIGDRFYLAERFGIWNQKLARWATGRMSPFFCRAAMSDLGHGLSCPVHVALIERYLPDMMDIPINDEPAPARYRPGWLNAARLDAAILAAKLRRRLIRSPDLQTSRRAFVDTALAEMPEGHLHGPATTWAAYGAERFLTLFRAAAREGS